MLKFIHIPYLPSKKRLGERASICNECSHGTCGVISWSFEFFHVLRRLSIEKSSKIRAKNVILADFLFEADESVAAHQRRVAAALWFRRF